MAFSLWRWWPCWLGGTQGAGRAALDQGRAHAVSALGVGEADPDSDGGALFCQPGRTQPDLARIFKAFALVGVPMLLVLKEPDLGTALTYAPILVAGLFLRRDQHSPGASF